MDRMVGRHSCLAIQRGAEALGMGKQVKELGFIITQCTTEQLCLLYPLLWDFHVTELALIAA